MPRVRLSVLWQRCALRRAKGLGGEICHAAGDMRAERAEMGYTGAERGGIWRGCDMRAVARREGERGDKKNALPRDIGILLFCLIDLFNLIFHC